MGQRLASVCVILIALLVQGCAYASRLPIIKGSTFYHSSGGDGRAMLTQAQPSRLIKSFPSGPGEWQFKWPTRSTSIVKIIYLVANAHGTGRCEYNFMSNDGGKTVAIAVYRSGNATISCTNKGTQIIMRSQ